jgi:hypothetical protein
MRKISPKKRNKANLIYNQCLIFAFAAGAISLACLFPMKKQQTQAHLEVQNQVAAQDDSLATEQLVQANLQQQPLQPEVQNQLTAQDESLATEQLVQANLQQQPLQPKIQAQNESLATKQLAQHQAQTQPQAQAPAPAATSPTSIKNTKIDSQFIDRMEGSILKGYVPLPGKSRSGVTIASGFDLGQMHLKEFDQLPIQKDLKAKLRPYVGLKKFQAVAYLKAHPLTINAKEREELNEVAATKILLPLIQAYDKSSKTPFAQLPPQAQTALFSFAYQYGVGFMYKRGNPKELWNYYITQNWVKVSHTLHSFKIYAPRRHQEAQLINTINKISYNG